MMQAHIPAPTPDRHGAKQHQSDAAARRSAEKAMRAITCFTPGTAITTRNGKIPVELLHQGDRVLTRDRGFQPVLWRGLRHIDCRRDLKDPDLRPVLIRAGALGPGVPDRDLMVSPRHRILTTDRDLLGGLMESEALIEARALVGRPGIVRAAPSRLTYVHLLFAEHEVILSDNAWSESFHLARPAAKALLAAQHGEVLSLFPQLRTDVAGAVQSLARTCLTQDSLKDLCPA